MGEHGGCGILLVLVLLVAVLFGAGYLLGSENLAASLEEMAAEKASAVAAKAAAEAALAQAQAETARAQEALRTAETTLAQLRQENAGLAWQVQRLAQAEAETARLREQLAEAEQNTATARAALEEETARRVAAEKELGRVPVTGEELPTASWVLLAATGFGLVLAMGAAVAWAAGNPRGAKAAEGGTVQVRMTREEARAYARWKAHR